jgi:hypothetical protein
MATKPDRRENPKNLVDRIPMVALLVIAAAIFVAAGVGAFVLGGRGQAAQEGQTVAEDRLQTAESKVQSGAQLAGVNLKACTDPVVLAVLQERGYADLCDLAISVQTQAATPSEGKPGKPGPGPTEEQIEQAVQQYCAVNDRCEGKAPTIDQLTEVIGNYLRLNPPEPGRPPTPEEIALAAANYIADHIEDFRGPKGQDAPPPTAEDLQAAVAKYCSVDNRCRGPQGPQGVGVTGTDLHRDAQGVCTLYFNLENPANGQVNQVSVQVNDEMCGPVQGPTTTTTTTESSNPPLLGGG